MNLNSIESDELNQICEFILRTTGCHAALLETAGQVIASTKPDLIGSVFARAEDFFTPEARVVNITEEMGLSSQGIQEGCVVSVSTAGQLVLGVALISPLQHAKKYISIVQELVSTKLECLLLKSRAEDQDSPSTTAASPANNLVDPSLQSAGDKAADFLWETGADLKFTKFSGRVEQLFGEEPEFFVGKDCFESDECMNVHTPNYQKSAKWEEHLRQLTNREPFTDFEVSWVNKKNVEKFVAVSGAPVFDDAGHFQGYRGTGYDITVRKKAARREAFSQLTFENAKVGIFWCYADGRFVDVNDTACEWLQYSREELLCLHVTDVNVDIPKGGWPEYVRENTQGNLIYYEATHKRKNGETFPVGVYTSPVEIDGEAFRFAFVTDLTEQKYSERELEKAHRQLQAVLDATTLVGIIATDTSGNITLFNPGAEKMLGYSAEELVGKQNVSLLHDESDIKALSKEVAQKRGHPVNLYDLARENVEKQGFDESAWVYSKKGGEKVLGYRRITTIKEDGEITGFLGVITDITEKERTEREAKKAAEMLQGILNAATLVGIIVTDNSGVIKLFNPGAEKLLGYSPDEIEGKYKISDLHAKREVEAVSKEFAEKLGKPAGAHGSLLLKVKEQGFGEGEWTYVKKNGQEIQAYTRITPLEEDGEVTGYLGIITDITKQRRDEAKIRQSEKMLNVVLNTIPVNVFWKDKNGKYLGCNQVFSELAGLKSPEEVIGKYDQNMFWGSRTEKFLEHDRAVMTSGQPDYNYETGLEKADGQVRWLKSSKLPLYDNDGEIYGVLVTADDVTEQKKSQEELKKLRNYLGNIIDSMPSILIGVDQEYKVTQWNDAAATARGVSPAEAIGKPLHQAFPRLKSELAKIEDSIKNRHAKADLKRSFQEDDQTKYEDMTIFPLISNGVEGAVIMLDDVTEQVRLEEMMIQSEKMLSVGGLAAGMAHEINNPLAGMIQTATVMRNRLQNEEMPANLAAAEKLGVRLSDIRAYMEERGISRMLDDIDTAGDRVVEIVGNMLIFARKSESASLASDIHELIDKTLLLSESDYNLKRNFDFKSVEIVRDYEEGLPLVPCESAKIQQVFLNLFCNGAEAMFSDKPEELHTFVIRTYLDEEQANVVIEVADNGPGMDEETRRRAFEPFYTTKPVGVGTGLGLSVSYFIVKEIHGGEMRVESAPESGAKFIIELPLEKQGDHR